MILQHHVQSSWVILPQSRRIDWILPTNLANPSEYLKAKPKLLAAVKHPVIRTSVAEKYPAQSCRIGARWQLNLINAKKQLGGSLNTSPTSYSNPESIWILWNLDRKNPAGSTTPTKSQCVQKSLSPLRRGALKNSAPKMAVYDPAGSILTKKKQLLGEIPNISNNFNNLVQEPCQPD